MRNVDYPLIWSHFLHSGVTHYCGAPTVQVDALPRRPFIWYLRDISDRHHQRSYGSTAAETSYSRYSW